MGDRQPSTPIYEDHSTITREVMQWLWPGRVPLGKITLVMGDPGTGKSLITLQMACTVSSGGHWPTGEPTPQGNVIILTDEDDVHDTIGPRIDVMGGVGERITQFYGVNRGGSDTLKHFTFAEDLAALEELIKVKDARLVVIDPISAYLGYIDSFKESDVRSTLTPLAKLAAQTKCAIVGVAHLNKNSEAKAVYRVGGSIAFTALARAVHLVAKDPDDEDRKIVLPVKCNVMIQPKGIAYRIVDKTHPLGMSIGYPEWEGEVEDTLDDVIGEIESESTRDMVDAAESFLAEVFDGVDKVPMRTIETLAKESRIPMKALLKVKRDQHIESIKHGRLWWWAKTG